MNVMKRGSERQRERERERERCEIIVVLFQARVISQGEEEEDITIMRNKAFIWIFFIYLLRYFIFFTFLFNKQFL
jgi:hypothetical protein